MNQSISFNMLGVVVAAYERLEYTVACLNSLLGSGLTQSQIVLVDGGSSQNTIDRLQNLFPSICLISGKGNLWWAEGMNVGIEYVLRQPYSLILLMNQDCTVDDKTIPILMAAAEMYQKVDVFSSIVLDSSNPACVLEGGTRWQPHPRFPWVWAMKSIYRPLSLYATIPQEPYAIDIFTAHGVLVRRKAFETAGLYDTVHFPQRGSDDDLGLRVIEAGLQAIVIPPACSYTGHDDSGVRRGPQGFLKRLHWYMFNVIGGRGVKTHYWFVRKHCPIHAMVPTYLYRLVNLVRLAWQESH